MRKIVIVLHMLVATAILFGYSQTNNYKNDYDFSIKTVEVVDSQLMDQILLVTEGDSVVNKMSNVFKYRIDFKKARRQNKKFVIFVSKRHRLPECYRSKNDSIYDDFLAEELKNIIFSDSLIHIGLMVGDQTSSMYETLYKGRQFYFFDMDSIENKPIFKIIKRRNATSDSKKYSK